MGTTYRFQGKTCNYTVDVSGGLDFGLSFKWAVQTVVCARCKTLIDRGLNRSEFTFWPDRSEMPQEINLFVERLIELIKKKGRARR